MQTEINLYTISTKTKGKLVYEYSPFKNYRKKDGKGQLEDFETNELNLSLENPVNILPQWSYDNSVNLIINDGKNNPKLINSRFSVTGQNQYQIIDRKGNNDTNIYDEASFDIDTSLYKNYTKIPKLKFSGVTSGGILPVGNYYFYFTYSDSDGNETDFFAESGLVSIFKGFSRGKVNTGFKNENSHKSVQFVISNIDEGFQYINVYYSRSSAEINQSSNITVNKITKSFLIDNYQTCTIQITGNEETEPVTTDAINPQYFLAESVKTQTVCQNRLFFGNVKQQTIAYKELADLSLRITPNVDTSQDYAGYDPSYRNSVQNTYYDPSFIYSKVGYQKGEIYRFGIVYIMNNNTLSPVFNIRGTLDKKPNYKDYYIYKNNEENRNYLPYDEQTGLIIGGNNENIYGVFRIGTEENEFTKVFGIKMEYRTGKDTSEFIDELHSLGVKGFFFVRQNRIPIRICQALTIGIVGDSGMPAPMSSSDQLITEQFFCKGVSQVGKNPKDTDYLISKSKYSKRLTLLEKAKAKSTGAFCPDYDVNYISLNSLFCGETYAVEPVCNLGFSRYDASSRLYETKNVSYSESKPTRYEVPILGVEDNVKQVGLNGRLFTSCLGEASEFKYHRGLKNDALFPYRAIFGPYLALDGYEQKLGDLINIYYNNHESDLELLKIRSTNQAPYEAISDRIPINELDTEAVYYRGDSYICTFTHRLNRNFTSDSAPTNDLIVDELTLDKYIDSYEDGDNKHNINVGDLNVVDIGTWFTFPIISNYNLNVRSLDESNADEMKITKHARGFYPYYDAKAISTLKIPEALCYNKGFAKSTSDRYNFELSDVPAIKNDFKNRIYYSNLNITDAYKNGFRVFQAKNYRDYPKTYGSITKLVEVSGNILCVFEHGIALIPVNERVQTGEGDGGNIYINTNNVLPENPRIISDKLGSQWQESVIKTQKGIYGVDTVAKKIWLITDNGIECISDFCIQEFLNTNISLKEYDTTPTVGIRNVKTHYNAGKQDVMFTFYDSQDGFEETSWNICYNEILQKWTTFYSWMPSYSENIDNVMFSFDREASKAIAKLSDNSIIELSNHIINKPESKPNQPEQNLGNIGELKLVNQPYDVLDNVVYSIEPDPFGNNKYFKINGNTLICETTYSKLNSTEPDRLVIYLNIKANFKIKVANEINPIPQTIEHVVALVLKDNENKLTTSFWKHGQAGLFDLKDKSSIIKPTQWYGKQHPFEFEFVVVDKPEVHKIFDNMQIIANKAKPDSFHYEIIGECYNFANDKQNMYFRQEAIKSIWNYNGVNIKYDKQYKNIALIQNRKSADLVHTYYDRKEPINLMYDYYVAHTNDSDHDYRHISGAEIIKYKNRDEYFIQMHAPAIALEDQQDTTDSNYGGRGLIASNMQYLEDKWRVQINPLEVCYCNEYNDNKFSNSTWLNNNNKLIPPLSIFNSPIPQEIIKNNSFILPKDGAYNGINATECLDTKQWIRSQTAIKDKFMKVKIRYKGNELAIINFIKTLYETSYA